MTLALTFTLALVACRYVDHTVLDRWSVRSLLKEVTCNTIDVTRLIRHSVVNDEMALQVATHNNPPFHALIDTGALVTDMTNKEVAECLLREGLKNLEGCVYLDESDRQMVLMRSSPHPVPIKECGLPWEARFTFYDQVHTTGIDIKQVSLHPNPHPHPKLLCVRVFVCVQPSPSART